MKSPLEILKTELGVNSETTLEEMGELSYYPIQDIISAMKVFNRALILNFIKELREKGIDHIILNELAKEVE